MNIPENGFYYHYKHDEAKGFNHHAYEIIGTGKHSEDDSVFVIYQPLYINEHLPPQNYYIRPLELFVDEVEWNGKTLSRFTRIIDRELIQKLQEFRDQL